MPASTSTSATERDRYFHPDRESLELATIMRVLGDPLRLDLVRLLRDGEEHSCGEITSELGLPPSTASYHMKLLREAGLTRKRAAGTQHFIRLRTDDLEHRFPGLVALITAPRP